MRLAPAAATASMADPQLSAEELARLRSVAVQAAAAGAAVIRAALDQPRTVSYKGELDLVTETDKAAELAALAVLTAAYPDHARLGEEGGVSGSASSPFLWCIDPLDGTTNFAHSYPAFACSVGVALRGVPVAGAVHEFAGGPRAWSERVYSAARGLGASCNGSPLRVSSAAELRRSLLATGFGYDHGDDWEANMLLWRAFTDECQGVRRLGAASVDLCHCALGVLDCYWEYQLKVLLAWMRVSCRHVTPSVPPPQPWDMAAGVVVLLESGGRVTRGDGSPFTVFSRSIVASNGLIHEAVLAKVGPATRSLGDAFASDWHVPAGWTGMDGA
jgi:myo-inositol-1(or 4)-monophosphatase